MSSLAKLLGIREVPKEEIFREPPPPPKVSPFDFVRSITSGNQDLWAIHGDAVAERAYVTYVINRGLSYSADTTLFVNEVNMRSHMPKQSQFEFLLGAIPKKKRFDKWEKADPIDDSVRVIMEYYDYNIEDAKEARRILTDEQIKILESRMSKGGVR